MGFYVPFDSSCLKAGKIAPICLRWQQYLQLCHVISVVPYFLGGTYFYYTIVGHK